MTDEHERIISREEVDVLHEHLRRIQEQKGYFFNKDRELVNELLRQLLIAKQTYSYMACPCRLANGTPEADKDIICPCVYREADIQEYGTCYCRLYASREWNEGRLPDISVPERRPPEKILF